MIARFPYPAEKGIRKKREEIAFSLGKRRKCTKSQWSSTNKEETPTNQLNVKDGTGAEKRRNVYESPMKPQNQKRDPVMSG